MMEDLSEDSKMVNLTIPFITLTVLMEDPEPDHTECRKNISQRLDTPVSSPVASCHNTPVPSKNNTPTKSFKSGGEHSSVDMPHSHPPGCSPPSVPLSSHLHPSLHTSLPVDVVLTKSTSIYKSCIEQNIDKGSCSSDDDDEEFHDSGDYFEKCEQRQDVDNVNLVAKSPSSSSSPSSPSRKHSRQGTCGPLSRQSSVDPPADSTKNVLKDTAEKFFESLTKLEARSSLRELRDKLANVLPMDHLG